jgi:predicted RNase H-like HicB family nuclease
MLRLEATLPCFRGPVKSTFDPTFSEPQRAGASTLGPLQETPMKFTLECEREDDGRWIAEVPQLPGVLAYGTSADEAMAKAEVLALRVLAERLEHGESKPHEINFSVPAAA